MASDARPGYDSDPVLGSDMPIALTLEQLAINANPATPTATLVRAAGSPRRWRSYCEMSRFINDRLTSPRD